MARNPEAKLQIVVCEYLDLVLPKDATYWASLNERKVDKKTGEFLNNMGRKTGVADLIIVYQGRAIGIELKLETNPAYKTTKTYQTPAQRAWQATFEACGGLYAVCRSTEDVRGSLTAFGVPIKEAA